MCITHNWLPWILASRAPSFRPAVEVSLPSTGTNILLYIRATPVRLNPFAAKTPRPAAHDYAGTFLTFLQHLGTWGFPRAIAACAYVRRRRRTGLIHPVVAPTPCTLRPPARFGIHPQLTTTPSSRMNLRTVPGPVNRDK